MTLLEDLAVVELPEESAQRSGMAPTQRLRRARPRSARHLLLEYVDHQGRPVAGQWFADRSRLRRVGRETARPGAAGALVVELDDPGVLLQGGGADRKLKALAGLVLNPANCLVAHRPERRAVVGLSEGDGMRYAKVVRPDRVAGLAEAARRLAAVGAFATPGLISSVARDGVTIWSRLPGRSLYELLDSDALVPAAQAAGAALRVLHAAVIDGLPLHSAASERKVISGWLQYLEAYDPRCANQLRGAAQTVDAMLDGLGSGPAVPLHRDCYDKHILACADDAVGLLDFDTLAAGDPALDLANVLVHFELRALQGRCMTRQAQAAAGALVAGYRPDRNLRSRLAAYAAATRLRLACVYRFRPDGRHLPQALTDQLTSPPLGVAAAPA